MTLKRFANRAANHAAILALRPYIWRELPGWGFLYRGLVGDYHAEARWKHEKHRWVRGKLHGYEMLLDLGYWADRSTFFLGRYYDLPTQLALKGLLAPGDTFVDVGANRGMISLLAARLVGPSGRVIAFEPNPAPRAKFETALKRNGIENVTIHPVGLGDAELTLDLRVPKINSGEGSFGQPNYAAGEIETISCRLALGDDYLGAIAPRVIKLDVEGYEWHALRGLEATLVRSRPILLTEIVSQHLANAHVSVDAVNNFLLERGFRPYRLGLQTRGARKALKLVPEVPSDPVDGDFLWEHVDNALPAEFADAIVAPSIGPGAGPTTLGSAS